MVVGSVENLQYPLDVGPGQYGPDQQVLERTHPHSVQGDCAPTFSASVWQVNDIPLIEILLEIGYLSSWDTTTIPGASMRVEHAGHQSAGSQVAPSFESLRLV